MGGGGVGGGGGGGGWGVVGGGWGWFRILFGVVRGGGGWWEVRRAATEFHGVSRSLLKTFLSVTFWVVWGWGGGVVGWEWVGVGGVVWGGLG